jgi:DNA-binding transcriptional ArsR family regulator
MLQSNEDMLRRIEALRKDMDALLESVHRSATAQAYNGMTTAFRKQIGRSFLEQNRDAFREAMGPRDEMSSQSLEVMSRLTVLYDEAIALYEENDLNGAMSRLEGLRDIITNTHEAILPAPRAEALRRAVSKVFEQMALMETLRFQVGRPMLHRSCEAALGKISPEEIERQLTPLANSIRLKIMAMLYTSSRSFSEMMKELGMQKGHLRFHLNKLIVTGYVNVDSRTHLYSIEKKGFLTIEGLGRLFSQVSR